MMERIPATMGMAVFGALLSISIPLCDLNFKAMRLITFYRLSGRLYTSRADRPAIQDGIDNSQTYNYDYAIPVLKEFREVMADAILP